MRRLVLSLSSALILASLLLASCQPASPRPQSLAPIPTQAGSTPTAPVAKSNTEDSAWQKVVAEAKKEGTVTAYSFGFTGDLGNALQAAFMKASGIRLDIITGTGSQLVPRIQSEYRAGQNVADLLEGATNNAIFARDQGLSQPYGDLPALRDKDLFVVDPRFDKQGHVLSYSYVSYTICINTKMVSPADTPKSWKDLLDPKWKGKIIVNDPDVMSIPNMQYVVLNRYLGVSDDYFRQLGKQELVVTPTQRESDSMLARGQYPILLTSSVVTYSPLVAEGAPIVPIDMAEGVPSNRSPTIDMMAKAPHPNATRLFLNWFMSKEGQDVHGRARSISSMRKDVTDYTPAQAKIKIAKIVVLSEDDTNESTRLQQDKFLSKMWKTK